MIAHRTTLLRTMQWMVGLEDEAQNSIRTRSKSGEPDELLKINESQSLEDIVVLGIEITHGPKTLVPAHNDKTQFSQ